MTLLKRRILIFLSILIVAILVIYAICNKCWEYRLLKAIRETPPDKKARMIAHNHNFVLSHVQPGMTKQQVEKAIGMPQNTDSEHVWMWASEYGGWAKGKEEWMDLLGAGTMYTVFLDGKVVGTPLGIEASAAMTPSELVMAVRGCDERTAFELLGVAPEKADAYLADLVRSRKERAKKLSTPKPQKENPDANPQSSGSQK